MFPSIHLLLLTSEAERSVKTETAGLYDTVIYCCTLMESTVRLTGILTPDTLSVSSSDFGNNCHCCA
jgi:hypothetical protein